MKTTPGQPNSRSKIRLVDVDGPTARFDLFPVTGKTHQLRIHMSGLGFRILNDRYYPELQPEQADNFEKPLRLVARSVRFRDPVSGKGLDFCSERELPWQQKALEASTGEAGTKPGEIAGNGTRIKSDASGSLRISKAEKGFYQR